METLSLGPCVFAAPLFRVNATEKSRLFSTDFLLRVRAHTERTTVVKRGDADAFPGYVIGATCPTTPTKDVEQLLVAYYSFFAAR